MFLFCLFCVSFSLESSPHWFLHRHFFYCVLSFMHFFFYVLFLQNFLSFHLVMDCLSFVSFLHYQCQIGKHRQSCRTLIQGFGVQGAWLSLSWGQWPHHSFYILISPHHLLLFVHSQFLFFRTFIFCSYLPFMNFHLELHFLPSVPYSFSFLLDLLSSSAQVWFLAYVVCTNVICGRLSSC